MAPELKRKFEYADLRVTPADGKRFELIRGDLHVTPSPNSLHQRISKRLLVLLVAYFEGREIGEVFEAPTDVILTRRDVFVPDLLVVGKAARVSERGVEGAPLLIVEILSPSTRDVDQGIKARRYAELGVAHYWIVEPARRRMACYQCVDGAFHVLLEATGDVTVIHPVWDGLSIDLALLWRDHAGLVPRC